EVVYSLSEILRYNLTRSGELVTLKEELRNVENYLQLMKIRFGERLNYRIEIDDRLMEVELPYFTLQPLVENAIMHGLEPKQGNGYVLISGRTLDDGIELVVEDNGLGMPAEIVKNFPNCLDAIVKKDSLGLINVHSRLQLCFGADFGLRIVQEKGKTQVKVLLPGEKTSGSLLQLSHY
ncbi:MAG: histidine kinase, partial [Clostridia bacterium]|nr:histidine kinase [Clostridia bacterium]